MGANGNKAELARNTFGRWTVISEAGRTKRGQVLWLCKCVCGANGTVESGKLDNGTSKSCGCLQKQRTAKARKIKLAGQTFGRWTVVAEAGRNKQGHVLWLCKCECGTEKSVSGLYLRGGGKSCGCLQTKHGESGLQRTPEYSAWVGMKTRCTNPKCEFWKDYGERGIRVCKRWLNSFENFLADVGRRTSPLHSLDRFPDNNGDYEPSNVRWATGSEQQHNRRQFKWSPEKQREWSPKRRAAYSNGLQRAA
jgi:hypothetical protein